MRTTECSRCGDCCERIHFTGNWATLQAWAEWGRVQRAWALENLPAGEDGMTDSDRHFLADAEFILAHWRPIPEDAARPMPRFSCSAFDPVARLCTAHDTKPPICRGYPWYGREPNGHALESPRCSFWADVPLDERPGAGLRLLPVLR